MKESIVIQDISKSFRKKKFEKNKEQFYNTYFSSDEGIDHFDSEFSGSECEKITIYQDDLYRSNNYLIVVNKAIQESIKLYNAKAIGDFYFEKGDSMYCTVTAPDGTPLFRFQVVRENVPAISAFLFRIILSNERGSFVPANDHLSVQMANKRYNEKTRKMLLKASIPFFIFAPFGFLIFLAVAFLKGIVGGEIGYAAIFGVLALLLVWIFVEKIKSVKKLPED